MDLWCDWDYVVNAVSSYEIFPFIESCTLGNSIGGT